MVDDNPDRVILLTDKQLNRPFWIFKQFVLSEDVLTNRFLNHDTHILENNKNQVDSVQLGKCLDSVSISSSPPNLT